MDPYLSGLVGGLVGTVAMTLFMMPMMKDQPMGTALFASKFLNKKTPEENKGLGVALHFLYGGVMGVVFAAGLVGLGIATRDLGVLPIYGAAFGGLLMIGMMVWMTILGQAQAMASMNAGQKAGMMLGGLAAHVVYGVVLAGAYGALVA